MKKCIERRNRIEADSCEPRDVRTNASEGLALGQALRLLDWAGVRAELGEEESCELVQESFGRLS